MPVYQMRPATADDATAICEIYNQGIEDRLATLETEPRTPAERREWLEAKSARHPVIVAEHEGQIVGWGSLNVFNARPAYRHVADFSVYVERSWRGKGVGRVLLERLIELAREHGYHKLVLSAFPFNTASGCNVFVSPLRFTTTAWGLNESTKETKRKVSVPRNRST